MSGSFDRGRVEELGWRQGSILGTELAHQARDSAPERIRERKHDYMVVVSHDCDILNSSLTNEPFIEIIGAQSGPTPVGSDRLQLSGRSPRRLRLERLHVGEHQVQLAFLVHDRWTLPRELLLNEAPAGKLPTKQRKLLAEWLAKRYIRTAFPSAFDIRWRRKTKSWKKLLKKWSFWIQGVYIWLETDQELAASDPYRCQILLVAPGNSSRKDQWPSVRRTIEEEFNVFWKQFRPRIECERPVLLPADSVSLHFIGRYRRFDADWVSFEDGSSKTPADLDFHM